MANIDVKNTQEQTSMQKNEQQNEPRAIEARGQRRQGGGLARRDVYFPSMSSLSPRDFFTASPFELMRRFTEEMDQAFGNFGLSRGFGGGEMGMWTPAIEVFEGEGNLVVRAELPGLNKEDVKVEMTDDGLVIQGERKREHEERREGFYRSERSYGRFYRLVPLPEDANAEQVRAQFNNGVLEISVPVPERKTNRREIPIEAGGGQQSQAATTGKSKG
jgi:HSP20 family protein